MAGDTVKNANVFMVKLDGDSVVVSLGYCDPNATINGTIRSDSVEELGNLSVPVNLLTGVVKKMISAGVDYQKAKGSIGLNITEESGIETVHL